MIPISHTWFRTIGRVFYAVAVIFFGAQHLLYGKFVTRIMPAWPAWVPAGPIWPYVVGVGLIIAGAALLFEQTARRAALFLGEQTLLAAVLLALPAAVAGPNWGGDWTNAGKAFALGGGALVVAATIHNGARGARWLVPVGRACLGGFFILGGIQHFIWVRFVMTLVPAWIPGAQFWTCFAGVALIAGGVGMQLRPTARLAAGLSAAMIFSWVVLLHIPRALADLSNANETTAVFEALAMSGIALLLANVPKGGSDFARSIQGKRSAASEISSPAGLTAR
ncbi:hypothetical protein [Opitutus sp. GAS368]|jgi:uncharacterized membrane protein|uniref:hypothetical protein n=1 Tax=Opitutus sp. GAS368 TaxID=1882749 RepID=UPI00087A15E4|nr:hypothetical protein [Opitutus sp. GAS368]SDR65246.1 hypothetical protein SAMN05444173_0013 [Opitutus sp. GAS368]